MINNIPHPIWFEKFEEQFSKATKIGYKQAARHALWSKFVLNNTIDEGIILEFGVAKGLSITWFAENFPNTEVYGFDSFEGLPEEWNLGATVLQKGHFSTWGKLPEHSFNNLHFVKGLFQETLVPFLNTNKEVIKVVHIDSDLYSSCKFILENIKERIVPGTILLFDELTYPKVSHPQYHYIRQHEYKAFMEFCEANPNFNFDVMGYTQGPQVAIKVVSV